MVIQMRGTILFTLLALSLFMSSAGAVPDKNGIDYEAYRDNWDFLPENKSEWLCTEYAVNYSRHHPGWGMVTLSPSPTFRHQPHVANYRIEENILFIHEPQAHITYELEIVNASMTVPFYEDFPNIFSEKWKGETYFYFNPNETGLTRKFVMLGDNRDRFFDYEKLHPANKTQVCTEDETAEENISVQTIPVDVKHDTPKGPAGFFSRVVISLASFLHF